MFETKTIRWMLAGLAILAMLFIGHKVWIHYNYYRKVNYWNTYKPAKYKPAIKDTTSHGYILVTPYMLYNWKFGIIEILDTHGNEIVKKHVNGVVYDFKQWKIDGHIRYTYLYYNKYADKSKSGLAPGLAVILDSLLNTIKVVDLLPYKGIDVKANQGLDLHDFLLLADNHYYTISHYQKTVSNIPDSIKHSTHTVLCVPTIQEVLNDTVVWQWQASDFPEFYVHSREKNNYKDTVTPQDYMHVNSICLDPHDSNLIVSFRHECQVIKISKKDGSIMWRLGGPNSDFPLTKEQTFLFQHNVRFTDGGETMILVDNGDSVNRRYSNIDEFKLDEVNKRVVSFKQFRIPEEFSMYMGSVEKYGDEYFISGGSAKYVMRVNTKTGKKIFELKSNQSTYRAQLVDSIYGLKNVIPIKHRAPFAFN